MPNSGLCRMGPGACPLRLWLESAIRHSLRPERPCLGDGKTFCCVGYHRRRQSRAAGRLFECLPQPCPRSRLCTRVRSHSDPSDRQVQPVAPQERHRTTRIWTKTSSSDAYRGTRMPAALHVAMPLTLNRLLRMLRQNGVTQEARRAAPSRQKKLTEDHRRYLLQERGLSQATAVNYLPFIDQFLSERFEQGRSNLSQLRAPDVTSFVQRHARDCSPGGAKLLVTAVRSFLRPLPYQGKIKTDLAACVPAVAWWSFATLPKFLPASDVQKVLEDCDRQAAIGRPQLRHFASACEAGPTCR